MSVINQMLKELDQRKAATTVGLDASLPYANTQESKSNRLLIALLGVIAILLIFVIYTLMFPRHNAVESRNMQDSADITTPGLQNNEPSVAITEISEPAKPETTIPQTNKVNAQENAPEPELAIPDVESVNEQQSFQMLSQLINQEKQEIVTSTGTGDNLETVAEDNQQRIVKSNRQIDKIAQAERYYRSAREKIQARQNSEAVELLEQSLRSNDEIHKSRILLFTLLLQQQQFNNLQPRLDDSVQKWPTVHEYRQMKARLLSLKSDNEAALALLESDIPVITGAPEYHELLAYIAQQLKKDEVAIRHYQMLLQQNVNRADWWLGIAVSEDRLGNTQPALEAYQQALDKQGLSMNVQAYARKRIKALQGF